MDVELREALDHGFGPEPLHRPLADRLEAGHRAVRRRRLGGTIVAVAAASVVGLGAAALAGTSPDQPPRVATDPTPEATLDSALDSTPAEPVRTPWGEGELARYDDNGNVQIRPGVTVLHRIDEPYGDASDLDHSVALAVEYQGTEAWLILTWSTDISGSSSSGSGAQAGPEGSFAAWVAQNVAANEDNSAGYVEFGEGETLVSSHGVAILEQRAHPDLPDNFAPAGARTAAALMQGPDGKRWWVVVRDVDGLEVISTPFRTGGETMDAFLAYAREKYESGEGLR